MAQRKSAKSRSLVAGQDVRKSAERRYTNPQREKIERFFARLAPGFRGFQAIATVILAVIILALLVEGASTIAVQIVNWTHGGYYNSNLNEPILQNQSWARELLHEDSQMKVDYRSYIGYKRAPFNGSLATVDANGLRLTDNPCASNMANASVAQPAQPIKIFMFGGSTTYGTYARNNGTIPSQLAQILCAQGYKVQVYNFGEDGFTSTQEMIYLQLQLQAGNAPDIVIFYDGVNEIISAWQNGYAGDIQNLANRKLEFNSRTRFNIIQPLLSTNTNKILQKLEIIFLHSSTEVPGIRDRINPLADQVVNVYLQNLRMLDSLTAAHNVEPFYFYQPNLFTKNEPASYEQNVLRTREAWFGTLSIPVDAKLNASQSQWSPHLIDLRSALDNDSTIYYADYAHMSEQADHIIAQKIANQLIATSDKLHK